MNDGFTWYKSWPKSVKKSITYPTITVHKNFEKIVEKNGDFPFLSILGISYTYREINESANKLANGLLSLGIEKGDKIGIFSPNLPQWVIAFFGILKSGAIVVPISPLLGSEDLKHTIQDSEAKMIIALDILYPTIEEVCTDCESLETIILTSLGDLLSPIKRYLAKLVRKLPPSPPTPEGALNLYKIINQHEPLQRSIDSNSEEIAVLAYTGGTTGTPKAAMLTHKNIISNLMQAREWAIASHPEGIHKKFLGAVPFFHLIGLTTVFLATAQFDSTVYLIPNPREFESILRTISKEGINYFHGVPTLFKALMNLPKFANYDMSSLDIIFSGGAPLPKDLAFEIENHFPSAIVVEAYGMTELSPMVSANPLERNNRKFGSIGLPIIDTEMKIVDVDSGEDLPQGETGEICVRGPQVMKGYWNKPDETELTIDKHGFLHTGDVGFMDQDGFFFIRSRTKDMIIASAYKVFPPELESMVEKIFPQIEELAVIGVPDDYQGEAVKLIVVLKEGQSLSEEKIVKTLQNKIAKYKVPKYIEFRTSPLPKTGIGKIDRKLLRNMD
ncbi:MAG: AMP-binding protein [Candidatus Hodarchaeales archaeon]|jgi:long-chain acyl-CoA synthetase